MFFDRKIKIAAGEEFIFKCLDEKDVTQQYVDSLNSGNKFLENANNVTFSSQKQYINDIVGSEKNLICGLYFDGDLIGTSGIQLSDKGATIGIFIFKEMQGRGYGKLLTWVASTFAFEVINVNVVEAGVKLDNIPSARSFMRCNFRQETDGEYYQFCVDQETLAAPESVSGFEIF